MNENKSFEKPCQTDFLLYLLDCHKLAKNDFIRNTSYSSQLINGPNKLKCFIKLCCKGFSVTNTSQLVSPFVSCEENEVKCMRYLAPNSSWLVCLMVISNTKPILKSSAAQLAFKYFMFVVEFFQRMDFIILCVTYLTKQGQNIIVYYHSSKSFK